MCTTSCEVWVCLFAPDGGFWRRVLPCKILWDGCASIECFDSGTILGHGIANSKIQPMATSKYIDAKWPKVNFFQFSTTPKLWPVNNEKIPMC